MSYIPPHKRQSTDSERSPLTPESLPPRLKRNLNLGSSRYETETSWRPHYADRAIKRWFAVGLNEDGQFPSYVKLEPVSTESVESKKWKAFALVNNHLAISEEVQGDGATNSKEEEEDLASRPWVCIAENVMHDLLSSFENVRNMESRNLKEEKPTLTATIGKVLFHGSPSKIQEFEGKRLSKETMSGLKKSFNTDGPTSCMEHIVHKVVPSRIGFEYVGEKNRYLVKLADALRPDVPIFCKCSLIQEQKKLKLNKCELDPVRHMVVDISCGDENMDLRLRLCTKQILNDLNDDEMESIRTLIGDAVIDPDVKGGLRWALGKTSFGDRFKIIEAGHTISQVYKSQSMRLKVRRADRFSFEISSGECSNEIVLKLKGITSQLQVSPDRNMSISEMLKDNLKVVWSHFICLRKEL